MTINKAYKIETQCNRIISDNSSDPELTYQVLQILDNVPAMKDRSNKEMIRFWSEFVYQMDLEYNIILSN